MRIASAVYHTLGPSIEEIREEVKTLRNERASLHNQFYCGDTGGWRRAVYLDMTNPKTNCPSGWRMTAYSKRTCGTITIGDEGTCDSAFFPVNGGPYSEVCGRIRAYQNGLPDAFYGYTHSGQTTINDAYFSGVAVMHGSPRQHIWTFAAGAWENGRAHAERQCPCDTESIMIPPFIEEDYFCESGYLYSGYYDETLWSIFYSNDTLWDGRDCHYSSTCCSLHNPPYFVKHLNQNTTDDLELRMCLNDRLLNDNIAVEVVEIYVK